jgi:uncharacterized coiled-coil DUF342 family protein
VALSEEEEKAEREGRDRLDAIDVKLRDLYGRRTAQLSQVRLLSEEQRLLADARAPKADAVEAAHRAERQLMNRISENRRARDASRRAADDAMADLREHRAKGPRGERPRPDQLKREMAELELRQQTTALPLPEENALIARMRVLRKELDASEKEAGVASSYAARTKELEANLLARRADVERLTQEGYKLRSERDSTMGSVRAQLIEAGALYAQVREKARLRGESMARVETLSREIFLLESEGNKILRDSRNRRFEAQKSVKDYNRSVRDQLTGTDRLTRSADAQFEELLRRGRITLGGGSGT